MDSVPERSGTERNGMESVPDPVDRWLSVLGVAKGRKEPVRFRANNHDGRTRKRRRRRS
jgi:hypothetical protein